MYHLLSNDMVQPVPLQAAADRRSAEPASPVEHAVEVDSDMDGNAGGDDDLIKAHGACVKALRKPQKMSLDGPLRASRSACMHYSGLGSAAGGMYHVLIGTHIGRCREKEQ